MFMISNYSDFLATKQIRHINNGFDLDRDDLNMCLFEFQKDIVLWSLKRGKSAIFADTGLGKTLMQIEWARHICGFTGGNVIIFAPLAVSYQTIGQARDKMNIHVHKCMDMDDVKPGINITNYERMHKFDLKQFVGVVLDESSILKSFSGKVRNDIINGFNKTPYKLACTATPAPNDFMELGNHSEFLDVMTRTEMLSMFFIHDSGDTAKWRIKGHAGDVFWEWVSTWGISIKKPSDFGYEDGGFALPDLNVKITKMEMNSSDGFLFPQIAQTLTERRRARKESSAARVSKCAEIANATDDQVLIWCDLNYESEMLSKSIPDAVEVKGADSPEHKEKSLLGFADGSIRVLVTKPSIAGFGMNWQNCNRVLFCGLSDSYEQYYQAIRRCWRFGQTRNVNVDIIVGEREVASVNNVLRKEQDARTMDEGMVQAMKKNLSFCERSIDLGYSANEEKGGAWRLINGDCIEESRKIETGCIDYTIYSPPFAELYTYSDSIRDMGNSKNYDEFFEHFKFLSAELLRITKPGRLMSFHCIDIPAMKERDGYIGIKDFPGDLIRCFQADGWIYHSRVVIWKNPLVEATRTKALGLMHKQLCKDSAMCRQGLPDYLITMRKPGINEVPISHGEGFACFIGENEPIEQGIKYSHEVWRRYASPVWMDINQSNTLNKKDARDTNDEKHICPLQLDVIARAVSLWSNPGDTVFSPFAGIGSELYESVRQGRKAIGIELKKSYFDQAVKNMKDLDIRSGQIDMFGMMEA